MIGLLASAYRFQLPWGKLWETKRLTRSSMFTAAGANWRITLMLLEKWKQLKRPAFLPISTTTYSLPRWPGGACSRPNRYTANMHCQEEFWILARQAVNLLIY